MKKIILTIVLGSLLPAMAIAEDKKMRNDSPNAAVMSGKHMMNSSPNASVMKGKHMQDDNPFSSHPKSDAGTGKTKAQVSKGYTVHKYKK